VSIEAGLRRGLLAVVILGSAAGMADLLLIGHYEDPWQYTPLMLMAASLVVGSALAVAPRHGTLRLFRVLMGAGVVAGLTGIRMHFTGNREFELEVFPNMTGWELFTEAVTGATPVLAPGTMAVIGLLGLLYAWRHPAGPRR